MKHVKYRRNPRFHRTHQACFLVPSSKLPVTQSPTLVYAERAIRHTIEPGSNHKVTPETARGQNLEQCLPGASRTSKMINHRARRLCRGKFSIHPFTNVARSVNFLLKTFHPSTSASCENYTSIPCGLFRPVSYKTVRMHVLDSIRLIPRKLREGQNKPPPLSVRGADWPALFRSLLMTVGGWGLGEGFSPASILELRVRGVSLDPHFNTLTS